MADKNTRYATTETATVGKVDPLEELTRQRALINEIGGRSALASAVQLAESMRATRYKDEAAAMADLIDNSLEAGASQVLIAIKEAGSRIEEIAVIDDGVGMLPEMTSLCMGWGVTTRRGRNGFGRFGFGLGNASIKYGTNYSVISRTSDTEPVYGATFDMASLRNGDYTDRDGVTHTPPNEQLDLPKWIADHADGHFRGGARAVRTVIIWRNFDRLTVRTSSGLQEQFLRNIGTTYRDFIPEITFKVQGRTVEAIDPLFTTEGARFYDVAGTKAEPLEGMEFTLNDVDGNPHTVRVRMSYIGHEAWNATEQTGAQGRPARPRFAIRKDHKGAIVCRNGRQIEIVRVDNIDWNNYSRQVGVEIDFPAELDELFGVTPDKQTIVFSDVVVKALHDNGLKLAVVEGGRRAYKENKEYAVKKAEGEGSRVSEIVLSKLDSVKPKRTKIKPTPEATEEAEKSLKRFIKEKAAAAGVPEAVIEPEIRSWTVNKKVSVEFRPNPGGCFYEPDQRGTQTVVTLNSAHPFFQEVYAQLLPEQASVRAGLEILLGTLARAELEAADNPDLHMWYFSERRKWSDDLTLALRALPAALNEGLAEPAGQLDDAMDDDEDE